MLKDQLGGGSYGNVFTVKYNGDVCAAKKIHPHPIENISREEYNRIEDDFIRACLSYSGIQHPNVVQFLGVYYPSEHSIFPTMVMELMDANLTMFVKINKSKITLQQKMHILYDVSKGLDFLHNQKPQILHHHLSPNNVMLKKFPITTKIGGLRFTKVIQGDSKQMKSKLTIAPAGTADFMPPEALVKGNPLCGTAIDVFSFGGIALHVFNEEWPTPSASKLRDSDTNNVVTLTETQRRQQYLDKMTDEVAELRKMVEKCLDDHPDKRPLIQELLGTIKPFKVSTYLLPNAELEIRIRNWLASH